MKTILITMIFLLPAFGAAAQLAVENVSVKKEKRNVEVHFDVTGVPDDMRSRQMLVLRPYLSEGADTLWLEPARIYGKLYYKHERQVKALVGNRNWGLSAGEAMWRKDTLEYVAKETYSRWMKHASLGVAYHYEGCGCVYCGGSQTLADNAPVYVAPVPAVEEVKPEPKHFEVVEAKKRWRFSQEMRVFFPVSKLVLYPDRYGNKAILDEIVASVRKIGDLEQLTLQGIEITGFASPEGGLKFNTQLGEGRAKALQVYLMKELPELREENFLLVNGVENWDGLRKLVEASDMEYREEVLAIIDDEQVAGGRKNALKRLAGGKPYRYMLKEFYPGLRNACYVSVYYDVLGDKAADAVNAANGLIRAGKYSEALEMLLEYRKDDRTFNSIGVCYMMLEDEEEAIGWFEKALQAGHVEAEGNLKQLK